MKVTIIAEDKTVYVDGKSAVLEDMGTLPDDVHAVQWDGARGEVEYKAVLCDHCGAVSKKSNTQFVDFTPYQPLVDAHAARLVELAAAVAASMDASNAA